MSIPDYQTLMLPVLKIAAEGEARVVEVIDRIADEFSLTQEQRDELLPSGRQRILHNRIHWAKFYLSKAGLIEAPSRGRFRATREGKQLLARQPLRIDLAFLMGISQFADYYNRQRTASANDGSPDSSVEQQDVTPEEDIEAAYKQLQRVLRADLIERTLQNTPAFFERLIVELLLSMGYGGSHENAARQLGRSHDGGIDGVIDEDRLGLDRVYIQAKRYSPTNAVGRPDVQAFLGSLVGLGATKGVFVTTSSFSTQAQEFVRHLPQRVILIDGQRLADLMIEHDVGVRTARTISFKRLDEDFFTEE